MDGKLLGRRDNDGSNPGGCPLPPSPPQEFLMNGTPSPPQPSPTPNHPPTPNHLLSNRFNGGQLGAGLPADGTGQTKIRDG
jgi:hypothetical protein